MMTLVDLQNRRYGRLTGIAALVAVVALSACTSVPDQPQSAAKSKHTHGEYADADDAAGDNNDPIEGVNRVIYDFNYGFDKVLLRPITSGYRYVMPEPGRDMVSNFLDNLYAPISFVNSIVQGDPQNTFATFWRFTLNTTFGVGGLFDFAGNQVGLHSRTADFGQSLGMYGWGPGPYLELPIIGPSNVRDAFGRLTDAFLLPTNYADWWVSGSVWGATAIDQRSRNMKLLDGVYDSSLDPYVTFRSLYSQKRVGDIKRARDEHKKALDKACTAK